METSYFLKIYDDINEDHYIPFKDIDMCIGTNIDVFNIIYFILM